MIKVDVFYNFLKNVKVNRGPHVVNHGGATNLKSQGSVGFTLNISCDSMTDLRPGLFYHFRFRVYV